MNIIKVLHQVIYLVSKEIIMLDCSFGIQLPKLPKTIAIITFNVLYVEFQFCIMRQKVTTFSPN